MIYGTAIFRRSQFDARRSPGKNGRERDGFAASKTAILQTISSGNGLANGCDDSCDLTD
jgi:hypothetical protein